MVAAIHKKSIINIFPVSENDLCTMQFAWKHGLIQMLISMIVVNRIVAMQIHKNEYHQKHNEVAFSKYLNAVKYFELL